MRLKRYRIMSYFFIKNFYCFIPSVGLALVQLDESLASKAKFRLATSLRNILPLPHTFPFKRTPHQHLSHSCFIPIFLDELGETQRALAVLEGVDKDSGDLGQLKTTLQLALEMPRPPVAGSATQCADDRLDEGAGDGKEKAAFELWLSEGIARAEKELAASRPAEAREMLLKALDALEGRTLDDALRTSAKYAGELLAVAAVRLNK